MTNTLALTEIIDKGASRICYQHPSDKNKCVKIVIKPKNQKLLTRELKNYQKIFTKLSPYIALCSSSLVQTNKGIGLECELLRDDSGNISKSIAYYLNHRLLNNSIQHEMDSFVRHILQHHLYFYDFNLKNFIIQIKDGKHLLKYTDLKSYNSNKSWTYLKLERIIPQLAKKIMLRRLKRLYQTLKFPFPQNLP